MRDQYVDVVRGMAMVLVVLGHTLMPAMPYLYMFHVALFFFVSGYLFRWEHAQAPVSFFLRRLRRLWVPYALYAAAAVLLHNAFFAGGVYQAVAVGPFPSPQAPYGWKEVVLAGLAALVFDHGEAMTGALWFIEPMILSMGFLALGSFLVHRCARPAWALLLLSVPLYLLGCYLCARGLYTGHHVAVTLVLTLPLAAGCVWREVHARVPWALKAAAAVCGLLAIALVYHATGTWVELSLGRILGPKWFALATFGGFAFCLGVCQLVLRAAPLARFFALVGRESYHVMALHFVGFALASRVLVAAYGLPQALRASFPVIAEGVPAWAWVWYLACGLALPLACVWLVRQGAQRLRAAAVGQVLADVWARARARAVPLPALVTGAFLACGSVLVFLVPPYQAPDEVLHLQRAWQVSSGVFFPRVEETPVDFYGTPLARSTFAAVPASLAREVPQTIPGLQAPWAPAARCAFLRAPLSPAETARVPVATVGGYTPLGYLPQAAACLVARGIAFFAPGFTAGMTLWLVRLFALAAAAVLVYLSLSLLPERRLAIAAVALLPVFVSQCASASVDAVVLPVLLLVCAYLLSDWRQSLGVRQRLALDACAALAVGGLKVGVYAPLLLLAALRGEGRLLHRLGYGALLAAVALGAAALWQGLFWLLAGRPPVASSGADPRAQLAFLAGTPLAFPRAFYHAALAEGASWGKGMVGILGWLAVPLPALAYPAFGALLVCAGARGRRLALARGGFVLALFACALAVLLIGAAEYLAWTPPGRDAVYGVQGRYLVPVLAAALLAVGGGAAGVVPERRLALFLAALSLAVTVFALVRYFY